MVIMMKILKTLCRRASVLALLLLTLSTVLTPAAVAHAQTRIPYRYTNDLISVNAFIDDDLSYVDMTGARVVAHDYRNGTTRFRFTMEPSRPNVGFAKATFEPSGDVRSATMTDGPAVARCLFYSSQGEAFVSKTFTRLVPLEQSHPRADAAFCYKTRPLFSRGPQIALFIDFEDGSQAIVLDELVMGISSTDFTAKFRRKVDDTGALDVKRIALVESPFPDTLCRLRLGRYAPDRDYLRFDLEDPFVDPVAGVTAVNCESSKAFDQARYTNQFGI